MWNGEADSDEAFRKKVIWGSAAIVVVALLAAGYYYKFRGQPPPPKVEAPRAQVAPPPAEPAIRNPVPAAADSKPLPLLKESDPDFRETLVGLFGGKAVERFLVPQNIIRH